MRESTGLKVINEDRNMIYDVFITGLYTKGTNSYVIYSLELDKGWDYVDPDYSDKQGWVDADRFIDDAQSLDLVQYFVTETLGEVLEEEGFSIYKE